MPTLGDVWAVVGWQVFGGRLWIPKVDLTGKTIIVTGANTGLGFECAKHLARLNVSNLILACRSVKKGNDAHERILKETGCKNTKIEVWEVDMASYKSVLSFGERVRTQLPRLDGFVANAGVELDEFQRAEGLEQTLTVNTMSTLMQAISILPKLKQTSLEHGVQTTLSIVGSSVHGVSPDSQLDVPSNEDGFEALSDPKTAKMGTRYMISKTILHQLFNELAARVASSAATEKHQVVVNIVNPGWCGSEIRRHKPLAWHQKMMFFLIGRTGEQGSRTMVHAVVAGKETHGRYLSECQIKPQSTFVCSERGRKIQKKFWDDAMSRIRESDLHAAGIAR